MQKIARFACVPKLVTALGLIAAFQASETRASDKLLEEAVQFTGSALFLQTKVPALVIGAVRNGEMAVAGYNGRYAALDCLAPRSIFASEC